MSSTQQLMPISYFAPESAVRLSAYADTIVYEVDGPKQILRAIRMGGYPEMVQGLSDVIYGGATIYIEANGKTTRFSCQSKQYQRQLSHDGLYAEATLLALDDRQEAQTNKTDQEGAGEKKAAKKPTLRKCCIFCPQGDNIRLFEELDRKTAVPLIPEYQDYLLQELKRLKILKKLTVLSLREKMEAWVLRCEKDDANIAAVVEAGLRSGQIAIPGQVQNPDGFADVTGITSYLNTFGVTVAQRIRNQFQPLFDPATEPLSPEILAINDYIREKAGYSLYDAQLAVAESVKRQLSKSKCGFIVAECGSGKTKIGATAIAAAQALHVKRANRSAKTFNAILCPSHVAKKWVRELSETLPDTIGMVVKNITQLERLHTLYEQGGKSIYAIIPKERARDGYMRMPAVLWNRRRKAFICPDCMKALNLERMDDGTKYIVPADQFTFLKENKANHKCPQCGSLLWTAVNPGQKRDWIKIGGYGWVYRYEAQKHLFTCKDKRVYERLSDIHSDPDAYYPVAGACRRYPLSSYLKQRFRGKLDGLIVDELHEYNNDSGQGDAMGEIFNAAKKVIGMTATLINGYSSGIFHLLYRVVPHLMRKDGKPHDSPSVFDDEYGVVETKYEIPDPEYAANRRNQKSENRSRQLPGVSPLVYSRFLLEHAAFLSLSDMGKDLPDYEEIPIPLPMEPEVDSEYRHIEKLLRKVLSEDKKAAKRILSAYLNLLTVYPDQPYDQKEILHPLSREPIVAPANIGGFDTLGPKEKNVLDIVRKKVARGEKVLIYTSWVRSDSQKKLVKLLQDNGYQTDILTRKVRPEMREEWVEKKLQGGLHVLIANPRLVETGRASVRTPLFV